MALLAPLQPGTTSWREDVRMGQCAHTDVCRVTLFRKQKSGDSCNASNLTT